MSILTSLMGLLAWDLSTDPYDHSQLANNFQTLDAHDHTTGKGKQIPSGGIANLAVTGPKLALQAVGTSQLADNSVNGAKIQDASIATQEIANQAVTGPKIANGAITKDKLDPNIVPLGTVISWYRYSSATPAPTGWEVCDGRPWASVANALGASSGNMPDLRNRFVLGAAVSGTGSTYLSPPDIGQPVGSHSKDFTHSHTVNPHGHNVPQHTHGIIPDGAHKHRFVGESYDANGALVGSTLVDAVQRGSAVKGASGDYQALYVPGLNKNEYHGESFGAPMETVGAHAHSGATQSTGDFPTGNTSPGTSADLGVQDVRPQSLGLLYLIRVL